MGGKRNTMVMMFVGGVVLLFDGLLIPYYSYSKKSMGRELTCTKGRVSAIPYTEYCAGIVFCCHDREMSAKSANI
jgi:hypothetical protein